MEVVGHYRRAVEEWAAPIALFKNNKIVSFEESVNYSAMQKMQIVTEPGTVCTILAQAKCCGTPQNSRTKDKTSVNVF